MSNGDIVVCRGRRLIVDMVDEETGRALCVWLDDRDSEPRSLRSHWFRVSDLRPDEVPPCEGPQ